MGYTWWSTEVCLLIKDSLGLNAFHQSLAQVKSCPRPGGSRDPAYVVVFGSPLIAFLHRRGLEFVVFRIASQPSLCSQVVGLRIQTSAALVKQSMLGLTSSNANIHRSPIVPCKLFIANGEGKTSQYVNGFSQRCRARKA